jgi:glycosyltransferase involved in cell wall biosynthesis
LNRVSASHEPAISVVIPTHDRAALLSASLASLERQDLSPDRFEVVVVDDASTDTTAAVCAASGLRQLRLVRLARQSGIASAKNMGLFVARAPIVFFFDDDDIADEHLLQAHLDQHRRHPDPNVAVLGFTDWAPGLRRTPIMDFVTGSGGFLFSYGQFTDGQILDYTGFWGGRSSCKRTLLANEGVFHPDFTWGCEDIELGYRLSRFGLRVIYTAAAISYMNRPITSAEFRRRCERQGIAQARFSLLHPSAEVRRYCQIDEAIAAWPRARVDLADRIARIEELERRIADGTARSEADLVRELETLLRACFNDHKYKGIVEALEAA